MKWLLAVLFVFITACGDSAEMARYQKTSNVSTISGVNGEFEKVAEGQSEMLSRKGGVDNQMETDIDMNGHRIYNLPEPQSPNEAARLQDIINAADAVINIQEVQQEGVINVKQQFGAGSDLTPSENSDAIDDAIAYGKAQGYRKLYFPFDTYEVARSVVVPSGWEVYGDVGRIGTQILQQSLNEPVLTNEAWENNTSPAGSLYIHDLWIKGSKVLGSDNHGIRIADYMTKIENVYVSETGGYGIYLDSRTEDGTLISTSLVENHIINTTIRNCEGGFRNGDNTIAPKLTDGMIDNLVIDMVESSSGAEVMELYEAAGWIVSGLHTYGNDTAIKIDKASNFNASNWYVENKGSVPSDTVSVGVNLSNTGRAVSFDNIVLLGQEKGTTNLFMDGDKAFRIFGVAGIDISSVNISNVSAVAKYLAPSEDAVILASRESTGLRISVSNFQPHFSTLSVVETPFKVVANTVGATTENGSFLDNDAELRLRSTLAEADNDFERIEIGSSRLPRVASARTTYFGSTHIGTNEHEVVLNMPELSTSDFFSGTLTINLSQNFTSTQQAFWTGKLFVGSSSGVASTWYYTLNEFGTEVNMSTDPTIVVNGAAQTITVTFTHDGVSDLGTGLVTYEYINGGDSE